MDIPVTIVKLPPSVTRQPEHPYDYGDDATVGVYLKTPVEHVTKAKPREHARFAGKVDNQYHVAVLAVTVEEKFLRVDRYSTIEEMHAVWALD